MKNRFVVLDGNFETTGEAISQFSEIARQALYRIHPDEASAVSAIENHLATSIGKYKFSVWELVPRVVVYKESKTIEYDIRYERKD